MIVLGQLIINGHDYAPYVKAKNGITWSRDNTNDKDAGRDAGQEMHTNVTSHQRKLELKMGPMPFEVCQQLEADLQGHDDGVTVTYPDLCDGVCTRTFYNTGVKATQKAFTADGVLVDDVTFTLISVREGVVT
jgi:hypothetical protein